MSVLTDIYTNTAGISLSMGEELSLSPPVVVEAYVTNTFVFPMGNIAEIESTYPDLYKYICKYILALYNILMGMNFFVGANFPNGCRQAKDALEKLKALLKMCNRKRR